MPPRSPFRFLAPGALLAVVVAVFLVVSGARTTDDPAPSAGTTTESTAATKKSGRRTYTIRANDNLTSIAQRYGLTVDELIELNPKIDPQALRKGQRLRLRD